MALSQDGGASAKLERLREIWDAEKPAEWLMRSVAMVLLAFALLYWIRLAGIYSGPEYRFDTMSPHWRLASSVMAVALPVAALGLWNRASWGVVLWFPIMLAEVLMYGWFSALYGFSAFRITFHVTTAFLYVAIRFGEHYWPPNREEGGSGHTIR